MRAGAFFDMRTKVCGRVKSNFGAFDQKTIVSTKHAHRRQASGLIGDGCRQVRRHQLVQRTESVLLYNRINTTRHWFSYKKKQQSEGVCTILFGFDK